DFPDSRSWQRTFPDDATQWHRVACFLFPESTQVRLFDQPFLQIGEPVFMNNHSKSDGLDVFKRTGSFQNEFFDFVIPHEDLVSGFGVGQRKKHMGGRVFTRYGYDTLINGRIWYWNGRDQQRPYALPQGAARIQQCIIFQYQRQRSETYLGELQFVVDGQF